MATKFYTDKEGRARPIEKKHSLEPDLMLSKLEYFTGSDKYYRPGPKHRITEGVKYISQNGYGWMVRDADFIISMNPKVKGQDFVVVKLKVNKDNTGIMIYEDGNKHVLYKEKIPFTDAKRDVKLYYSNGVFMLPSEY
ncbi:MAG: hypothetical protein JRN26_00955 [Nitrososphaerota archaeon]|jgi:hypothetical protein|nr:hypothetical protein [Nitrososphaerota archaeon]MDG6928242.1 hypothetical protein [Nitrososphaerota archaeon]MDG6930736.1 hypothetical protein [Nitrososphaerota archaeon]MDG6931828.1 hypothetical protein [Nitrososphaerota archaeon]MDG6935448.1 hypothetical protein [Nitrososphaerota archaeon]